MRFAAAPSAAAAEADGKIRISVEEIGKTADLIGRLGKPLGTWVTVKGKWALPKKVVKDFSLRFTVTHVNGAKLEKAVEFHVTQIMAVDRRGKSIMPKPENRRKLDGQTWTLNAYETGEFHITPPEYYRAVGIVPGSMQEPYYFDTFTSKIDGVLQPE
ncbi:MAG TPA: hypothetical protein VMV10_18215 [Pirellulales bacterium]|nr:hypothetical protein [Pirellulales bacterium]